MIVRPLRIKYSGAVYHVTSRGDRREPIAKDDVDRSLFLEIVGRAVQRFDARVWAYCLMGNHYHLVLQTREANLSRLMRQINGVYTQSFNRRHALSGHLFQGRFKAQVIDADPVRATPDPVCPPQSRPAPQTRRTDSGRALGGISAIPLE